MLENYSNIKSEPDKSLNVNDHEMNIIHLNNEDLDNSDIKVFHIKASLNWKQTVNMKFFKMRHCRKIRSIIYNDKKYSSLYHPQDDRHAFYIKRNKNGIFSINLEKKNGRKQLMIREQINEFIFKLNRLINITVISPELRKLKLTKIILIAIICIVVIILAFCLLNIIFFIISLIVGNNIGNTNSISTEQTQINQSLSDKILIIFYFFICLATLYVLIRLIQFIRAKEKYVLFTSILNKKDQIDTEIQYLNNSILHPINMNCLLSDTMDYIQIFYDKDYIYEIETHFN